MQLTHIALWTNHLERYYEGVIRDPDGNIVEIVANGEPEIQVALFPPYELLLEARSGSGESRGLPKGFGLLYRYGTKFRCRRDRRGSQGRRAAKARS